MFEKVKPYMGNYMLYTKKAVACIAFATLCSVVPYFLLYGMIHPLVTEGTLLWSNVLLLITGTALCLILNAVLYVKGLSYSHYSAYHTLENIRISLQQRLEKQPLPLIVGRPLKPCLILTGRQKLLPMYLTML